ncbi:membrane-associated oxidoreductase [Streptomyces filamentosus NRRL 15998]|uniref:Membrane-associated oxidoreductase n=1 Tax=Streptomyces filamentosus NRRL 15998 TaxID=457431 RepID=D6ARB8_STRFL|nr:membrane-associated oxidoreductase [Streptomyces filamentosus NRRL 15998]
MHGGSGRDRAARRRYPGRPQRGGAGHVAVLPQRDHLRLTYLRHDPQRPVHPAHLGAGAERRRAHGGAAAAGRTARPARPGGGAEAPGGADHREAGSGGRPGLSVRGADRLPFRAGGGASRVPLHDAAAGGLRAAPAGGGTAADRGRSASAALPGRPGHPADRRPDRHGSADQPAQRGPGPARAGHRRGRYDGRAGPPGRDDRDAGRAEPARDEGGRFAEPARQPAARRGGPARAERPAADGGAHALHDRGVGERRHGEPGHHSPVRRGLRPDPGARHPLAELREPGRGAAGRRPVRGRGGPAQGPVHHDPAGGAVAAPDRHAGAAVQRGTPGGGAGRAERREGGDPDRPVDELAGPRRSGDGRLRLREPRPLRPLPALPAAGVGAGRDPGVRPRAVRAAGHGDAQLRGGRGRPRGAALFFCAAAARRCCLRRRPGGTSRTGRWRTATGRGGPRCGWRCCGRRVRRPSRSTHRPRSREMSIRSGIPRCTRWIC